MCDGDKDQIWTSLTFTLAICFKHITHDHYTGAFHFTRYCYISGEFLYSQYFGRLQISSNFWTSHSSCGDILFTTYMTGILGVGHSSYGTHFYRRRAWSALYSSILSRLLVTGSQTTDQLCWCMWLSFWQLQHFAGSYNVHLLFVNHFLFCAVAQAFYSDSLRWTCWTVRFRFACVHLPKLLRRFHGSVISVI